MKSVSENDGMLAEINVTPLVDVVLVLLIIFMVTAPLIQQGIAVNLPRTKASQPLPKEERDIVLTVSKNRKIMIDTYSVSLNALEPKLREIFKGRKEKRIYIKADQRVPYGTVVAVMGSAKAAGIDRIGMITEATSRVKKKRDRP